MASPGERSKPFLLMPLPGLRTVTLLSCFAPTTVSTLKAGLHFIPRLQVIHKDSEDRI